ncbi:hypothetical protein [Glycomyces tenuis]|uniref:hypothetical protein n=1 Tax=Glycomyces tenuis TaxID=58116 RepID=UPI000478C3F5|nr:hypothetical protein [Glycomyces tenuis]
MLPQPNFGPTSSGPPDDNDEADEGPPRKLGRLRIALWVQTAFAVLAGNYLVLSVFSARQATLDQLIELSAEAEVESPTEAGQELFDFYNSTQFLVANLIPAGIMVIAAVLSALCAVRLKTRLKTVRRVAIATSIVLLLLAMLTTLMVPAFFLILMIWVFASILAVWWLFSGDVKDWMSESTPPAPEES